MEPVQAHIVLRAPARAGDVAQAGRDQQQGCVTIGEVADHACPAADLPHDAFQRIGGPDLQPVRPREAHINQGLGHAVPNDLRRPDWFNRDRFGHPITASDLPPASCRPTTNLTNRL